MRRSPHRLMAANVFSRSHASSLWLTLMFDGRHICRALPFGPVASGRRNGRTLANRRLSPLAAPPASPPTRAWITNLYCMVARSFRPRPLADRPCRALAVATKRKKRSSRYGP